MSIKATQPEDSAVWLLIHPAGSVVAREASCVKAWARIHGYKMTVEGLLGYEESGWRVERAALATPSLVLK